MLPAFNEFGYLPPGIHIATIEEIVARFGTGSPEREVETLELTSFVDWARQADIKRLIVNGSYVTAKMSPNDIDIVALPGRQYPNDERSWSELQSRWPFLQVFIAIDEADLDAWAKSDFGTDRNRLPKGVVEVLL